MGTPLILPFPGTAQSHRVDVGTKAASLIRMSDAGLPVPAGVVLTSSFFAPWFGAMEDWPLWTRLIQATPDAWPPLCSELRELAGALPLTVAQGDALDDLLHQLVARNGEARFAVRSSSPEEDLASASFAGIYETRLGVRADQLEQAIRHCFSSSLDIRVFSYRKERGFDLSSPRFAAIVQRQIDSETAGIGFSINPLTNDYDEAVFDANWGLGTSVVDGRVTPDHFVVNRVRREVVEETRGDKRLSVWLDRHDGTAERRDYRAADRALTDAQLRELCDVTCRIEMLYDAPVDIEWAYAEGKLHILQARPVTRYVPLPPEMVTPPGERRRLYADAALSKGMTTNEPISPLGLDNMERMFSAVLEYWVGPFKRDVPPEQTLFFFAGARMYMNTTNLMWLASPSMLSKSSAPSDALMAEIISVVDAKEYRALVRPPWISFRLPFVAVRMLWRSRGFLWNTLRTIASPESQYRRYLQQVDALDAEMRAAVDDGLPLDEVQRGYSVRLVRVFDGLMAVLVVGILSPELVIRRKSVEARELADKLRRGVKGDVVVEMGIALHRLAGMLDRSEFEDLGRLVAKVQRRALSAEFLSAWDEFVTRFGCRGPMEMDLASPRYADDPLLALRQMSFMAIDGGFDPEAAHQRHIEERQEAYEELMRRSGPLRRALLRRIHRLNELFAGTRDTPKQLIVLGNYALRRRALRQGELLTEQGRLDAAEHVFDLTFDDLRTASEDSTLDLRALREERTRFLRKLRAHVRSFPPVIDSRGRILRPPPKKDTPGLLSGMPVSAGVVTGRVKVLHRADEKPVEKGDVLVAYVTDPGWTPLFMNAAAIVLEVGGVLQHGAVVAREYGKPCVVGIDRAVTRLRDGQLVEVDGTRGTVRLL